MSNAHFAKVPNINIPRSKFHMPTNLATTFNHGQLIPIDWFEILPGDTFTLNLSSLIRMSTPIFPIMDNIELYVHAFFCPMRLVWSHTEEFYGDNKESAGYQTEEYQLPFGTCFTYDEVNASSKSSPESLASYLNYKFDLDGGTNEKLYPQCVLPSRCYHLIWSEWYRAEQLQDPFIVNKDGNGNSYSYDDGVGNRHGFSVGIVTNSIKEIIKPYKVCKKFDYFTAATLAPQYGASVALPLGSYAPIVVGGSAGIFANSTLVMKTKENIPYGEYGKLGADYSTVFQGDLKADLSEATAATINSIRYAFQVQKYLERSNFGSRFFEMLAVHYGVTSPDARLQRPEYLGGTKFNINVNQVLSTAGYEAGSGNKVGSVGAVSVTGNKSHIFTKGFVEPGYVMVLVSTKQDQTYSQGIDKALTKKSRWEVYSPEFANIGDQPILKKEIYAFGPDGDNVFGYQEAWAEYRYRPNRTTGLANPMVDGALDYMTLANKFNATPSLGETFIQESRDNITRCLTTGVNGPDYIADFYFDYTAIRELPTYSIPGLVDHFGAM